MRAAQGSVGGQLEEGAVLVEALRGTSAAGGGWEGEWVGGRESVGGREGGRMGGMNICSPFRKL